MKHKTSVHEWHIVVFCCGLLQKEFNTLRPRQDGRHFPDDIFKRIFLNENKWILLKISLKFVRKGPINNILALVQIMAWRHPGDKPLSEPMMVSLLTHIWLTRPHWVKEMLHDDVMERTHFSLSASMALCGESTGHWWKGPVTHSFDDAQLWPQPWQAAKQTVESLMLRQCNIVGGGVQKHLKALKSKSS